MEDGPNTVTVDASDNDGQYRCAEVHHLYGGYRTAGAERDQPDRGIDYQHGGADGDRYDERLDQFAG